MRRDEMDLCADVYGALRLSDVENPPMDRGLFVLFGQKKGVGFVNKKAGCCAVSNADACEL